MLHAVRTIFERELKAYFTTPLAYVFIVIFLALTGSLTFFLGGFFERGQADLAPFFLFHPWLYLFLVPAIAMRLWAEERRTGTIELLMTLPTTTFAVVLGKFLAAWAFAGIALAAHLPDVADGELAGRARQRRDPGLLSRQLGDGRRLHRHRRLRLGADQEPGDRLRGGRRRCASCS